MRPPEAFEVMPPGRPCGRMQQDELLIEAAVSLRTPHMLGIFSAYSQYLLRMLSGIESTMHNG
jgi:hypothetical protein